MFTNRIVVVVVEEWNKLNKHVCCVVSAGTVTVTGAQELPCVGQLDFCNTIIISCSYAWAPNLFWRQLIRRQTFWRQEHLSTSKSVRMDKNSRKELQYIHYKLNQRDNIHIFVYSNRLLLEKV